MASYREFAPPSELRGLLECGWRSSVGVDEPAHEQRVLPDGCMDLIWSADQVLVAGPDTAAFTSARLPGQLGVGLRFRPGAAPTLLGLPAHELRDRRVALTDVHPGLAARVEALSRNGQDPAHALIGAVRERLPAVEPPSAVRRAATLLAAGAGVSTTAECIGWTARTLHRRSLDAFGYGPSTLRRVLRFRRALGLAWRGVPLSEVAALGGYADQAHLAREVRALAGAPLGRLLARSAR